MSLPVYGQKHKVTRAHSRVRSQSRQFWGPSSHTVGLDAVSGRIIRGQSAAASCGSDGSDRLLASGERASHVSLLQNRHVASV